MFPFLFFLNGEYKNPGEKQNRKAKLNLKKSKHEKETILRRLSLNQPQFIKSLQNISKKMKKHVDKENAECYLNHIDISTLIN